MTYQKRPKAEANDISKLLNQVFALDLGNRRIAEFLLAVLQCNVFDRHWEAIRAEDLVEQF
jgi:hypothetical protein